jgi:hypothetical protein
LDIQSYIALGIVALTVAAFAYHIIRFRKKSGCGRGCCCGEAAKNDTIKSRANR